MIATRNRRLAVSVACLAAVAVLAALAGLGLGGSARVRLQAAASPTVTTVTISNLTSHRGYLRRDYIGFSYESNTINSGSFAAVGNYPTLLGNFGGAGVLRFGGIVVDSASYTGVTAATVSGLAGLLAKTGLRVLYSVNLGHFNATAVAADAKRIAKLGTGLYAIACGNEPELYHGRVRPASYTEASYLATDVPRCVQAVRTGAPGARFAGPDTFHTTWLPSYAAAEKGVVNRLAEHWYPTTHCGTGTPGGAATLLSRTVAAKEASVVAATRSAAAADRIPFSISETNSASCGGIPGVANTYASALWAADWLLIGAENGAGGMYFHGSLSTSCGGYTPLCKVGSGQYAAMPVYYGMLFAHEMGSGWTLPLTLSTAANVAAHAVRDSTGKIRVMVENLSAAPQAVVIKVPGVTGTASTLSLTGGSLGATTGVRIQGAAVTSAGTFKLGALGHLACSAGSCKLTVPAYTGIIAILP